MTELRVARCGFRGEGCEVRVAGKTGINNRIVIPAYAGTQEYRTSESPGVGATG